jgi:hypothetical protein
VSKRNTGAPTKHFLSTLSKEVIVRGFPRLKGKAKALDFRWKNSQGFDTPISIIGTGNDKIVLSHTKYPEWVFKVEKADPVTDVGGLETSVWRMVKGSRFERMLAPIISFEGVPVYAMKKGKGSGDLTVLEDHLAEIAGSNYKLYKDLDYYLLDDANASNRGKVNGKTVLIDYDNWYLPFRNYFMPLLPNPRLRRNGTRQIEIGSHIIDGVSYPLSFTVEARVYEISKEFSEKHGIPKQSPYTFTFYVGDQEIGYSDLYVGSKDDLKRGMGWCKEGYGHLVKNYPQMRNAPLVFVYMIDISIRGKGLGVKFYRAMGEYVALDKDEPIFFAPWYCYGGTTSKPARKVWDKLKAYYPNSNYVFALIPKEEE